MEQGKVICDTDVIIDFLDEESKRYEATLISVNALLNSNNLLISLITKMELMSGSKNKKELLALNKLLSGFDVILINEAVSSKAHELFLTYRLSHSLSIPDCLIAATAIAYDLQLYTYNKKDYIFINGLKLYNPNT